MADTQQPSPGPDQGASQSPDDGSGPSKASGDTNGQWLALARRWHHRAMTDDQLLLDRVEYQPPIPCCASCRHLGEPIRITDRRGERRVRRACPRHPLGFTAPDWLACPAFEAQSGQEQRAGAPGPADPGTVDGDPSHDPQRPADGEQQQP